MKTTPSFAHLTDADLHKEVARLVDAERGATAAVIASIEELDRRRLYLPDGFSSMFAYCTQKLHLGEGAAYRRIEAARASRRFPVILDMIQNGAITLTSLGLISQHLTVENHAALLLEIRHKSKQDVARIVACLHPLPDVPSQVRKLPVPKMARADEKPSLNSTPERPLPALAPTRPPVIAPLSPERFKLQVTMSRETHDVLREIQDLMRHSVPNGDAAKIVARALTLLRDQLRRRKFAELRKPERPSDIDLLVAARM